MSYSARRFATLAFLALPLLVGCGASNPYQGMDAEQLFLLGRQKYEERDWNDAIRALERLMVSFGTYERTPEARMLLAQSYFAKKDYLTARSEYQRFLDRFPGHDSAAAAALGICSCLVELSPDPQRDQGYTNEAMGLCRNVVVDYAGTAQAEEAARKSNEMRMKLAEKEFLNADFYFRRKLYDSAIIYYEFVVRLYPETDWAPMALLQIFQSNKAIGYEDLAEDARKRLLELYPDSPAAAQARADGAGS